MQYEKLKNKKAVLARTSIRKYLDPFYDLYIAQKTIIEKTAISIICHLFSMNFHFGTEYRYRSKSVWYWLRNVQNFQSKMAETQIKEKIFLIQTTNVQIIFWFQENWPIYHHSLQDIRKISKFAWNELFFK